MKRPYFVKSEKKNCKMILNEILHESDFEKWKIIKANPVF